MPNSREQLLRQRAGRHAHRRLPRTGPLQHAADRAQKLHRAGQIAMPGPRPRQIVEPLQLVVAVDHLQRDRAAQRHALPDAGQNVDRIGLDPLPPAAAVPALPPPQLDVDRLDVRPSRRPEIHPPAQSASCRAIHQRSSNEAWIRMQDAGAGCRNVQLPSYIDRVRRSSSTCHRTASQHPASFLRHPIHSLLAAARPKRASPGTPDRLRRTSPASLNLLGGIHRAQTST